MGDVIPMLHKIARGLDLPIRGTPSAELDSAPACTRVAVLADDYVGMKPRMAVQVGDTVQRGQLLFEDRKNPGVRFTAPGAGEVAAIHRGARRALRSVVIALAPNDQDGTASAPVPESRYDAFTGQPLSDLNAEQIRDLLVESGQWTAFRARPFGKIPGPNSAPEAIFVTAIDTRPLAPPPEMVLSGQREAFARGLAGLAVLAGEVYLCRAPGASLPASPVPGVDVHEFGGPHPAGLPGLHIHALRPVSRDRVVWHVGYQDVAAMGHLLQTGKLLLSRTVSIAGPAVKEPRLMRTRMGASIDEIIAGRLTDGDNRVLSGCVLSGRAARGEVEGYLGRYHNQISALAEDRERRFLGWLGAGFNRFSTVPVFVSKLFGASKRFDLTTSTHGSRRSIVPIGMYERVMPMDIMPTFLLRALLSRDLVHAEQLGCLELDEEDLALCTFVCPGKNDYGPVLRDVLDRIEKEG